MKNADEHAKLLAQLAELERNSVNYFDVEREFFLIDSNNLHTVRPRLYGYSIQTTGIYENDNLTEEAVKGLDGRGCYVYVEVKDGKITIKQDLNGCCGIYLFRHGDYFALSNSFFRLLDHVKFKYPLTVNHDYCHYVMVNSVSVQAYSQTAVNEIQYIARNAVIHVDIAARSLELDMINYKEHSVPLDSAEGVAILDRWVDFWANLFRNLAQRTKFIQADLTGGFDTRIHFVPLLHSGINLNRIRINSYKSYSNPVLKEDSAIASEIADHYGFKLNQPLPENKFLNYSLSDSWNIDLYSQQTIRNLPEIPYSKKRINKLYHLSGISGEFLRKTWHMPPQKFIDDECAPTKRYSRPLSQELARSVQNILTSVYRSVREKYHIEDPNSIDIPQYLYHETRTRTHCGKGAFINYLKNTITIVPSHDPEITTLQLKTSECPDYNLLMVLLFTRYAPDLLKIRFDKFHEPPDLENLIPYAKQINERFQIYHKNKNISSRRVQAFHLQSRDTQSEQILLSGKNNPAIPYDVPEASLKAMFESNKIYGLFVAHFDEELYRYAQNYYDSHTFWQDRYMYSILGVTKVLEDVEISRRNRLPHNDMLHFLKYGSYKIDDSYNKIINKIKDYIAARIDVKLLSTAGDFQILSVSDDMVNISKPKWFQKNGTGYVIQSYYGNLEFVAKTTVDGKINLHLKGLDIRNPDNSSERLSYWIDYTKLIVNGKVVFDKLTPAWHDKPYAYNMDAKAGEEIKVQVEWLPHRDTSTAIAPPKEPQKKTDEAVDKTNNNSTARVDIKLFPKGEGDFQILDVSDDRAEVLKPAWFNKDGIGYKVQSFAGKIEFIAKTTADGQIKLLLRGIDVRTPEDDSKRIPYWIDYTKLTVNGKVVFDKLTPAWHDKAFSYNIDAKAGDEIKIQVEWLPHRSDV